MAYLGNKPVNNFVSFAKQDITGNGGTSYSLDYPVTGANDIELYINNVRQEPTEAYSCAGSTLTLTGAVSSTDDVYVIFRGRALQTAQHPSDSALEATQATLSGNAIISGTTTLNGLTTISGSTSTNAGHMLKLEETNGGDNFIIYKMSSGEEFAVGPDSANTDRWDIWGKVSGGSYSRGFSVDAQGRVMAPQQPTFAVYKTTASSSGTYINYNSTWHNVGSHYSSAFFTAPVSGVYHFYATCLSANTGGASRLQIRLNGSPRSAEARGPRDVQGISGDSYQFLHTSATIQCSANDSVGVYFVDDQSENQYGDVTPYNTFGGFLVG